MSLSLREPKNPKFTFIDLFAGIGGFRIAFQSAGGKCVFSSEWDSYAAHTYELNYGERPAGDITQIDPITIPQHDVLTAGFPCQPFSIAGVTKHNALGNEHGFRHATQGTLFFNVAEIINAKRPKAFVLENVKNLVTHDRRRTFEVITGRLQELGYKTSHAIIDAKHYVPQHRERVYIVGFLDHSIDFKFPEPPVNGPRLRDILEKRVPAKYTLTDHLWEYLQNYAEKHRSKGNGFGFGIADPNGITRTLSARYYKDGSEILIAQAGKNPRRLTPRECARLMGFPDEFVIQVSDTRAYKQFGNSVAVPVVHDIAKRIVKCLKESDNRQSIPFHLTQSVQSVARF